MLRTRRFDPPWPCKHFVYVKPDPEHPGCCLNAYTFHVGGYAFVLDTFDNYWRGSLEEAREFAAALLSRGYHLERKS